MSYEEFKSQYLSLQDTLYKVAYYILESDDDAQDAVQDLYLRLWMRRDELTEIRNVKAYCLTILKNICLDRIRSASTIKRESVNDTLLLQNATQEEILHAQQCLEQVKRIMAALPEREALVLRLRVFDNLEYEQISEMTGMSNLTLRVLLSNARKKIKNIIER